ncbi:MAG: SDR family oxidoreductase [Chloroflexi bacterium]|nr:SDR family oxidoreductase [Chloroflexota bacterium]
MTRTGTSSVRVREPELVGQTLVVIGGSSGMGLETARRARAEGAQIILAGRNPDRLRSVAVELGAKDSAAFDAYDSAALEGFFQRLPTPIDHVMVTGGGPYYARLSEMDLAKALANVHDHVQLTMQVARESIHRVRPGGSLLFISGTGARRPAAGLSIAAMLTAATPALVANLALELAPIRVNLIAPGFVDTPLSAALLGDNLEKRREQLRQTLPIGRVVGPADVAALAVHLMTNSAVTGATYDIDGGQQLLSA